jgi:mannitol operon transcriptional antiterminator
MCNLNSRQYEILQTLIESPIPLSVKSIASNLGISGRIVRYNLPIIEYWLSTNKIHYSRGSNGYILLDESKNIRQIMDKEINGNSRLNPLLSSNERFQVLLLTLMRDEPLVIKELEQKLGVSRPTIIKDLNKAAEWLSGRHLQLIRRTGFGIQISGREEYLRATLVNLLLDDTGATPLLAFCDGFKTLLLSQLRGSLILRKTILSILDNLDLRTYRHLVGSVIRQTDLIFTDEVLISLILHVALLVKRVSMGKVIISSSGSDDEEVRSQLDFARELSTRIEKRTSIHLPASEVEFIEMQVSVLRDRYNATDTEKEKELRDTSPEILFLVGDLLREASYELHPYLPLDQDLIYNLTSHLKATIRRLQMGYSIRNPLLSDIKRDYPYIFKVAQKSSAILSSKLSLNIPDEEIGYIAMHFAAALERLRPYGVKKRVLVVSGNSIGANTLLVSRIHNAFPDIHVEDIKTSAEITGKNIPLQIDGVISTVRYIPVGIPSVVVGPLLTEEDKTAIKNTFFSNDLDNHRFDLQEDQASLTDLLTPDTVQVKAVCSNWEQAVDRAGDILFRNRMVEIEYISAIKKLIVKYGAQMVIMPGVALLHARPEDGVRHIGMSLVSLQKAVPFGNSEYDPVDIIVCLAAINNLSHVKALMQLMSLLKNKKMQTKMRNAKNTKEMLSILAA